MVPASMLPLLVHMEPVSDDALATMRARYPELPDDYIAFRRDTGFGGIGRDSDHPIYMIYSGPVEPSSVYGSDELDERFILFGDDFCGQCAAFDRRTGQVVEIEHEDRENWLVAETFSDFIEQRLALLAKEEF